MHSIIHGCRRWSFDFPVDASQTATRFRHFVGRLATCCIFHICMVGKWWSGGGKCKGNVDIPNTLKFPPDDGRCWKAENLPVWHSNRPNVRACVFKISGVHSEFEYDSMWGFSFSIKHNYMSNCQLSVNNEHKAQLKSQNRCHLVAPQVVLKSIWIFCYTLFLTTTLSYTVQRFSYLCVWLLKNICIYISICKQNTHRHGVLSIYICI